MTSLGKALALLTPDERRQGSLVLVMIVVMALLETTGMASIMPFLAVLGNPSLMETHPLLSRLHAALGSPSVDTFLVILGVSAFLFVIVSAIYRAITQYVMARFIELRRHTLGKRLLETYLRQPYAFFLDHHSADLSKTILSEVDQVVKDVFRPVIAMLSHGILLLGIIALLVVADPLKAVIIAVILGGVYLVIYGSIRRRLGHLGRQRADANRDRFVFSGDAFSSIKLIKLSGREHAFLRRYNGPSRRFASTQASIEVYSEISNHLVEVVIFGSVLLLTLSLMAVYGGAQSGALGEMLPLLGLYAIAAYRMKPAAHHVYKGVTRLRYSAAAVDRIYADLKLGHGQAQILKNLPKPLEATGEIVLDGVGYRYAKSAIPALSKIYLRIPVGSSVGIVGSTGAGKTTLVDVILGLLRPTEGFLRVDGQAITEENLRAWQRSLGYVPQQIVLTDNSIEENIAFGIPPDQIDHSQVVHCARLAHLHDWITRELPGQYATLVGEQGVRLSGGQRQRIGIARALYHNPSALVLDEATSALDSVTEQAVMDDLDSLARGRTLIMIAHRLSSVRRCDKIVLLDKGRIVAEGRFEELEQSNEQFRRMARISVSKSPTSGAGPSTRSSTLQ